MNENEDPQDDAEAERESDRASEPETDDHEDEEPGSEDDDDAAVPEADDDLAPDSGASSEELVDRAQDVIAEGMSKRDMGRQADR